MYTQGHVTGRSSAVHSDGSTTSKHIDIPKTRPYGHYLNANTTVSEQLINLQLSPHVRHETLTHGLPEIRGIIFLLFLGAIISYLDRAALSIAAPMITQEFGLNPAQFDMEFHYPSDWTLVATGKRLASPATDEAPANAAAAPARPAA